MRSAAARKDDGGLSATEQRFLDAARTKFRENSDWFAFEEFAFGSRSPLFSAKRSHRDVLTHPLYRELKEMWLQLGVRQGRIAQAETQKDHAPRRQTSRRR
jgi:hypothetical protein